MSLSTQFYTMLAMVGMGSWLGAALDTYGRFLKRPMRARWVVFINDFMFWLVQGLILFYILLLVNEGELRVYIFLAVLCGYATYQSLLKQLYLRFLELLIQTSLAIYRFLIKIGHVMLVKPIIGLFQLVTTILLGLLHLLLNIIKWGYKILITIIKFLFMPILYILKLFWKLVPKRIRVLIGKNLKYIAGFKRKIKNIYNKLKSWWRHVKKK